MLSLPGTEFSIRAVCIFGFWSADKTPLIAFSPEWMYIYTAMLHTLLYLALYIYSLHTLQVLRVRVRVRLN